MAHPTWATFLRIARALYSSSAASYYSVPLFLYRRLRDFYVLQTVSSAGRLLVYVLLNAIGSLNSVTAAGFSALNATINGYLLKRKGGNSIEWPEQDDPAIRKEIIQYILPALPAILLGAFHGQIALFLISIFGSTSQHRSSSSAGPPGTDLLSPHDVQRRRR